MHLTLATVGTLISGVLICCAVFVPELTGRDRLLAFVVGGAITAYAIWGITRTSGTFVYHPAVFVLPVLAIGYLVVSLVVAKGAAGAAKRAPGVGVSPASRPVSDASGAEASPPAPPAAVTPTVPTPVAAPATSPGPAEPAPWDRGPAATQEMSDRTVVRAHLASADAPSTASAGSACLRCGVALRPTASACPRCGAPV